MEREDQIKLAVEAYLYGFPLVFNLEQINRYVTTGIGSNAAAPFNQFSHARTLAGVQDKFVSINNDTVYSMAQLDLSVGPLVLKVPDTADRYYVLQFVDAWTNNFAYVGKRATGTKAREFLLTPPNWQGEVPENMLQIKLPTRIASIVGRWECNGESDLEIIKTLQDQTTLTPFNKDSVIAPEGFPVSESSDKLGNDFFEQLKVAMWSLLPSTEDQDYQKKFAKIGLDTQNNQTIATDVYDLAEKEGRDRLVGFLKNSGSKVENGWQINFHIFDYNKNFFEVGAINSPEWIIKDPQYLYVMRAAAAMGGLWGNHAYEAAYLLVYVDENNEQLNGENTYTLTLSPPPPVDGFWSITMYDIPDYYLVGNEINRYSIGNNTKGIIYNDDGSITLTVSNAKPEGKIEQANWLPAPQGDFRPILRMYLPSNEILDGSYHFPGFVKVNK